MITGKTMASSIWTTSCKSAGWNARKTARPITSYAMYFGGGGLKMFVGHWTG